MAENENQPTEAELAEQAEWDDAVSDLYPHLRENEEHQEEEENEQANGSETTTTTTTVVETDTTTTTTTVDPSRDAGTTTTTTTLAPGDNGEPSEDEEESAEPNTAARDSRLAQRQWNEEVQKTAAEVKEKLYPDIPKTLVDSAGDPITSIDDVMQLVNPATKKPFTQDEAGMWLLSAQQEFNKNLEKIDKQAEQIAETNMDLKDQADSVALRYGALLKQRPELQDALWTEYQKSLVKDPATGIIVKAPMNLESFYDLALKPYIELADQLEQKATTDAAAAEQARKEAEDKKLRQRQDRSDIYGNGKVDNRDEETKEWDDAAKVVFNL